jgi:glycosyltransferase involved in cell wall biosynthesis
VVGSWLPDAAAAAALAERHGLPTVAIAQGSDVNFLPTEYPWWSRMAANLTRRAAAAVYVSESLRTRGEAVGLSNMPSSVIPNGVDAGRFTLGPRRPRGNAILSVGHLTDVKGHRFLLEALRVLRHEHGIAASVRIVGVGPLREELLRAADALGIAEAVELVGALSGQTLVDAYHAADVFCLPSRAEGFASVIPEAMATGLPVVATDVGGSSEVVTPVTGALVPACEASALAAALAATLNRDWDPDVIRAAVVPRFTWDEVGRAFRRLVAEVVDEAPQAVGMAA